MRIDLEQTISFSVSAGFQSAIACTFANDAKNETLIVSREKIPARSQSLADIMASRRAEFEAVFGTSLRVVEEKQADLLARPCQEMAFTLDQAGTPVHGWFAVALIGSTEYLEITFMTADGLEVAARFARMLASVSLPETRADGKIEGGWVHRYAGPIALDVPASLHPPHVYSFISVDRNSEFRVRLYRPDPNEGPLPTIQQEVASDTQYGAVVSKQESNTFTAAGGYGTLIGYLLTEKELVGTNIQVIRRAQIAFPDGLIVLLYGRASESSRGQVENAFQEVIRSMNRSTH